jgi:hypothetical protein
MVGTLTKESMVRRPLQFSFEKTHHFLKRGCHLQQHFEMVQNWWQQLSS